MALAHLDRVEPVVAHIEAEEHTAVGALAQVLDHHILVHKRHPAQLCQVKAGGLPAPIIKLSSHWATFSRMLCRCRIEHCKWNGEGGLPEGCGSSLLGHAEQ